MRAFESAKSEEAPVAHAIRGNVLSCLGRVGVAAAPAVPLLIEVLADPACRQTERANAAEALGNIGPAAAAASMALKAAAEDMDPRVSRASKAAIKKIVD